MSDREQVVRWTEAERTFGETQELVEDAITASLGVLADCQYMCVRDLTPAWVVYEIEGAGDVDPGLYQCDYTIDGNGKVTLTDPKPVEASTTYQAVTESVSVPGRVLEARGQATDGARVYRVQIIDYGQSKNGRLYPAQVMREASRLYEGAKAYDHHRTDAELATSTITGLVGSYRNVLATDTGIEADLHVLPGATHTSEALDASLAAIADGLPPLVGISHDVLAKYRPSVQGGQRFMEATQIVSVNSADVVADPAAGGRPTRMVAGGTGDPNGSQEETTMNLKQLLALLRQADAAKRAELLKEHGDILTAAGLDESDLAPIPAPEPEKAAEPEKEPALAGATEAVFAKDSLLGSTVIAAALKARNLDDSRFSEAIGKQIPERFTEAQLTQVLDGSGDLIRAIEASSLAPGVVAVTKDERDNLTERLDAFFSGDYQKGFTSFKEAYFVWTGKNRYGIGDEDVNRMILRESIGNPFEMYDSTMQRATESATASTWNYALGDSITRRMVAEYQRAGLDNWNAIVSSSPPINDFRTQRIDRVGGYGVLPTVNESAPYQPLTTPGNEEATYSITKKGGTEDVTLETIANDDVRLISRIPQRMGLAAARTLWEFVWGFLPNNAACTYDSVALFHASHSNTTAVALSNSGLNQLRTAMRRQTGYGDTHDILSLTPKTLIVPPDLEDLGNQLTQGGRAVPATTPGASDVPNLHQGMNLVVVDFLSDTNDWFIAADPAACPILEVGFYQGRQTPELFSQSDPTTGAVFNADKFTYKLRHIYGGVVVDHRGLQRATQ